jgi:hypothetical protein
VADARTRYYRKVRRLRASARRWSVVAAGLCGATAVLTPYHGLGIADALWAAGAGSSLALALWRWSDLRALTAQGPPAPDPALDAGQASGILAALRRFPAARAAVDEVLRHRSRYQLRGTAAAGPWQRLDRASVTLAGLADRLTGAAAPAVREAAVAERSLRDLAQRTAAVEKALRLAPADARGELREAHQTLIEQLTAGVEAYERLVAAAASYVAEAGRTPGKHPSVARLTDAADLLRGIAAGLAELRDSRVDGLVDDAGFGTSPLRDPAGDEGSRRRRADPLGAGS